MEYDVQRMEKKENRQMDVIYSIIIINTVVNMKRHVVRVEFRLFILIN